MKIKFHPTGVEVEGDPNKTLLQICIDNKVEIKSICKGVPSCAECRVRILAGESNLIPPNKAELSLIGTSYYIDGRRLACQVRAFGDVSVDITDHLDKDDSSTKKLRGFRPQSGRSNESRAVQGTLVLQETPEKPTEREPRSPDRQPRQANPAQNADGANTEGAANGEKKEGGQRGPREGGGGRSRRGGRGRR